MNQVILLSSRHEQLQADDRVGILSAEQRYLEMMAYVFKLNDELKLTFMQTLAQLKNLESETRQLNQSADSLSAQLEISIEEMLL